uniref:Uncharacterized protein n=1 Tax=Panagrolaimus sp. ES5 TaxID=591445 RepID=A0AC34G1B3_9BILA
MAKKKKNETASASKTNIKNYYNITRLIPNNSEKAFVAHVSSFDDENQLKANIYGRESKQLLFHIIVQDAQAFVKDILNVMDSKIQAIIFKVFEFENKQYVNNVQFCKALKAKCDGADNHGAKKIPYEFISDINFGITRALVAGNVCVKFGETVLVLFVVNNCSWLFELKYTPKGYKKIHFKRILDFFENTVELEEKIRGIDIFKRFFMSVMVKLTIEF